MRESNKLLQQGKSLSNYYKAKSYELIQYFTLLYDKTFWKSRDQYLQMLNLFLSKKIGLDEFTDQFSSLLGSNRKTYRIQEKKLEEEAYVVFLKSNETDAQLNPESRGFTKIISDLYYLVDTCDSDVTLEMNLKHPELLCYGISEEYFRFAIEEDFLPEVKEYCKKF